MARIRNWGELNYHIQNEFNREFGDGYLIVLVLRLDKPISFEQTMVEAVIREYEGFEDADYIAMESSYELRDGEIENVGRFCSLFPLQILKAFMGQKSYPIFLLSLDNIDRIYRGGEGGYFDVEIAFEVPDIVQDPDRFLRSFARRLNNWLTNVRKAKKLT